METKAVMNTEDNNQETTDESTETSEETEAEVADKQPTVEELQKQIEDQGKTIGSQKRDLKKANKTIEATKKAVDPEETPEKTDQQPSEPDYARLAYLKGENVVHPDDQKIVMDEAKRLNLPLTDVLQMEHIKSRIETAGNQREAKEGMPDGTGRTASKGKDTVEYFEDHPDETPEDLDLHNKVIDAKVNKIENESKFSKVPFIG